MANRVLRERGRARAAEAIVDRWTRPPYAEGSWPMQVGELYSAVVLQLARRGWWHRGAFTIAPCAARRMRRENTE